MSRVASTWPPVGVTQRILDHKGLAAVVRDVDERDDAAPHLARYLVVRSAGLVEAVRDDVADEHCRIVGPARPHRRVASGLRSGQGAAPGQLVAFVRTFDVIWGDELELWLAEDDSLRADQLGSLVGMRKKIAHGDGERVNTGASLRWAGHAVDVANWLVARFDPA